jgi:hypothetical protein
MSLPLLFGAATLVAAYLATIGIGAPGRPARRLRALLAACLFMPLAYGGFAELLGKPKPVTLEWWLGRAPEATVLASSLREGRSIHLWLQLDGVDEPRAYVLPWSRHLAEQLQATERAAAEDGSGVRMRLPFEPTLDDREPRFYALPQPAPPPKDENVPPPLLYRQPGADA